MKTAGDIVQYRVREAIQAISEINLIKLPNESIFTKQLLDENIEHRKVAGMW